MPDYTVPDPQLAELWLISDHLAALVNEWAHTIGDGIATWEPAPMEENFDGTHDEWDLRRLQRQSAQRARPTAQR